MSAAKKAKNLVELKDTHVDLAEVVREKHQPLGLPGLKPCSDGLVLATVNRARELVELDLRHCFMVVTDNENGETEGREVSHSIRMTPEDAEALGMLLIRKAAND